MLATYNAPFDLVKGPLYRLAIVPNDSGILLMFVAHRIRFRFIIFHDLFDELQILSLT
jgi:hypothetical protein